MKKICPLIFTLCLAALVIFENCTMESKVLCKIPGCQSAKVSAVHFSTGALYETGHILPDKVLQMIVLQLICQMHRW